MTCESCLCLPLPFFFACCAEAAAADFPRILPGTSCAAQIVVDGKTVEVELRLLSNDVFILQTLVRRENRGVMQATVSGSWRQSGDGAHLLLDNPFGLHRRAEIGSRGTVYLGHAPLGPAHPPSSSCWSASRYA